MTASVVCFAPHLIDYTAYAIAQRPDGSVVVAGQARDRWHGTPYKFYGARAVVQVTRRRGAQPTAAAPGAPRLRPASRSARRASSIDGLAHDGTLLDGRSPGASTTASPCAPTART